MREFRINTLKVTLLHNNKGLVQITLSRGVLLCLLLGGVQSVSAQSFVRPAPSANGAARALQVASDGDVYLGGLGRAWIARINPFTNVDRFRIHLGNDERDAVNALVLDHDGNAYAAGVIFVDGKERGFTAVLRPDGTTSGFNELPASAAAIALNENGVVYAGGNNFVTTGNGLTIAAPGTVRALAIGDAVYAGGRTEAGAGYLARLNEAGDRWDTVLSFGEKSEARAIAVGVDGSMYVAGVTRSLDFAVRNAFQSRLNGPQDAFLAKLLPDGRGIAWATYLGGSGLDSAAAIAVDLHGDVLIVGSTTSPDFPLAGQWNGVQDGFFARFDASGRLLESAYAGTSGTDGLAAVTVDRTGTIWTAGAVRSFREPASLISPKLGATASQIGLSTSPNPSVYGAPVTLSATVTPSAATGVVTFYDGAAVLGSSAISAGQAKLVTIVLPAGSRPLRAYYAGDATYNVSTSAAVAQTVTSNPGSGFASPVNYTAGNGPFSVVVADFNGDGKADMAAANYYSNDVSVFLGNGNGTFQAAQTFGTGTGAIAVAVGDFNGDGKADLAIANFIAGSVSVLLGNGDGTFRPATQYPAGSGANAISVADFNSDGKADLAIANFYDNTVSVLLGNGDGTFQTTLTTATGIFPAALAVGDFNGDGKTDLAVANSGADAGDTGSVSVLLGKGDGSFQATVNYTTGINPSAIAVADFNLDGRLDLAVANYGDGTVSILRGLFAGVFASAVTYTAGSGPYWLSVADFNGDARPDLAVVNYLDNTVSVLLASAGGTLQSAVNYSLGNAPTGLAAGDFNGDGRADLAASNSDGGTIGVLLAIGSQPSAIAVNSGSGQTARINTTFAAALQAKVTNSQGIGISGVTVMFTAPSQGASGTFAGGPSAAAITDASGVATAPAFTANLALGNYNVLATVSGLTGNASFAMTNSVGTPSAMTANAGTTPQSATILTTFANALAVTIRDAGNNPVSGVNITFTAAGSGPSGVFGNNTATFTVLTNASGVASAPFTANGLSGGPYAVSASATGLASVNFSLTNTAGPPSTVTANPGSTPQSAAINTAFANALAVTVKDAGNNPVAGITVTFSAPGSGVSATFLSSFSAVTNASGVASLNAVANNSGGTYQVTASVSGLSAPASFTLTNTLYMISGQVTVSGTGKSGVTVTLSGTQTSSTTTDNSGTYLFSALGSGGYTVTPTVSQYFFTPAGTVIGNLTSNVIANFSGSAKPGAGIPDKAGTTYSGYSVLDANGNFAWDGPSIDKLISWSTFQAGEKPIYGDWNGDGKIKVGVYNNGTWLLDYNGNGVWDGPTVDKAIFWSTGQSTDVPVMGDWNGDGRTKIGIYNNGTWILDYNGNGIWEGPGVDKTIYWSTGQSGEVPVVGDWNGDGKSKIGIYANGTWILEYNGNYAWDGTGIDKLIFFGGAGYRPMVGDWNGSGWSKIGAYHVNGTWAIDYNGNFVWDGTSIDKLTFFGGPDWLPLVGDWNGSGTTKIGAYTNGQWALDYNGNFGWDVPPDRLFSFGAPGQTPIVGKW